MQQSIDNKLGEINFRKKIVEQQTENKVYFNDEFNSEQIEKVIAERMDYTYKKIKAIADQNIPISPYIEIGAERGQRSLIMENDLNAYGAAVDLSFDSLRSCAYYKVKFNKSKIPLRICTDAYNLPFKSGAIPFIFCYQTLHHFPDPTPIIREVFRVLSSGGLFLFDEEPYRKMLHLGLYTKRQKIYSPEEQKRNIILKIFDHFFADETCNETDHNVLENDKIPLKTWKKALSMFDEQNVELKFAKVLSTNLNNKLNLLKYAGAYLTGGSISGICRKNGVWDKSCIDITEALICPSCLQQKKEVSVEKELNSLICKNCKRSYPESEGIYLLFNDELFDKLYPEIYSKIKRT